MHLLRLLAIPIIYLRHVHASQGTPSTGTCPKHHPATFRAPWDDPRVDPDWPYPTMEAFVRVHGPLHPSDELEYIGMDREVAREKYEREISELREIQLVRLAKCSPACVEAFLKWEKEVLPRIMKAKRENRMARLQAMKGDEVEGGVQVGTLSESTKKESLKPRTLITMHVMETTAEEADEIAGFAESFGASRMSSGSSSSASSSSSTIVTTTEPVHPFPNLQESERSVLPSTPKDLFTVNFVELNGEDASELQVFLDSFRDSTKQPSTPIAGQSDVEINDESEETERSTD